MNYGNEYTKNSDYSKKYTGGEYSKQGNYSNDCSGSDYNKKYRGSDHDMSKSSRLSTQALDKGNFLTQ